MCWKYKNPHGTLFIWCEILNGKEHRSNYLAVLDKREYYNNAYNYCPYCGNKLEERRQSDWKN